MKRVLSFLNVSQNLKHWPVIIGENGFILFLILWCIYLAFATESFLSSKNLFTILRQSTIVSIVAIGEMIIMLMGGLDVSIASILGISGVFTAGLMVNNQMPPLLAVLVGIVVGGVIGAINGLIVTKLRINPVIATLGMMNVLNGISFIYTGGKTIYGEQLETIGFLSRGYLGLIPIPVLIMLMFYGVFFVVLNYTVFGAQIYAIGNNEKASWLSGIPVDKAKIQAFILSGLLAGFGGVMQVSRQGSATAGMGDEFLFPILTAVILGGVSLSGGKGKIQNTLIAAIFLVTITNGLVLLGTSIYLQRVVSGLILILALSLDRFRMRVR